AEEISLEDQVSERAVLAFYEALAAGDAGKLQQLLAPDLEWWFHGPPTFQHLMRFLSGKGSLGSFTFSPQSVASLGPVVIAEGRSFSTFWVHAWTVRDGVITQLREYFNTSVTVTRFSEANPSADSSLSGRPASLSKSASLSNPVRSSLSNSSTAVLNCSPVWESSLPGAGGRSVPGLVLAI
ncbi:hypothetical protein AMTR_s00023p00142590, partial [Amborella trichopoda]